MAKTDVDRAVAAIRNKLKTKKTIGVTSQNYSNSYPSSSNTSASIKCQKCGKPVQPGWKECAGCGNQLAAD